MPTKNKKIKKKSTLVHHESNIKAVLSFVVLLIALAVFMLFNSNKDVLLNSPSLKFFVVLVVILSGLLVSLIFLVNPQKHK
jgi:hypothetical protein